MNVLAITAHPDDAEIFMYGLLSILKQNHSLYVIIATDGSAGGEIKASELAKLRSKEAIEGLKLLTKPIFLNYGDGKLYEETKFKLLSEHIDKIQPDLVITHSKNDYHSDHRALSKATIQIIDFHCPILFCDTLLGVNFIPEFYIDITSEFNKKKQSILKHKSQSPERFLNAVEINNKFRAAQCNAPLGKYAEAYSSHKGFPHFNFYKILPNLMENRPFNISYNNKNCLI